MFCTVSLDFRVKLAVVRLYLLVYFLGTFGLKKYEEFVVSFDKLVVYDLVPYPLHSDLLRCGDAVYQKTSH